MKELTDEMILKMLRNRMTSGCVVGLILLAIGIILLIRNVKKMRENDANAQMGMQQPKSSQTKIFFKNMLVLLLLGWGIACVAMSLQSYGAVRDGYDVYKETILEKNSHYVRTSNNKGRTLHYFYFSSLGKCKVSSGVYDDYQEGDSVIVILSKKNKIIKIYDASEYMYIGA